jgi:hypothetical protein
LRYLAYAWVWSQPPSVGDHIDQVILLDDVVVTIKITVAGSTWLPVHDDAGLRARSLRRVLHRARDPRGVRRRDANANGYWCYKTPAHDLNDPLVYWWNVDDFEDLAVPQAFGLG